MELMILAIIVGSAISLAGGSLIFTTQKRRKQAISIAMPFGAGALLAAAFFDLLPEAFEQAEANELLIWLLGGFLAFFVLERSASWFHHHHEHQDTKNESQRKLIVIGDMMHNAIDGVAIGVAFLISPATGLVTTLAVAAHEIPKELGTFALLLSRGWKDKIVLLANVATAVATIVAAVAVYLLGSEEQLPLAQILTLTSGFFIYIAASDIIPDIHEQPRKLGTIQAAILIVGIVLVGSLVTALHNTGLHNHDHGSGAEHSHMESDHDDHEHEDHEDEEHHDENEEDTHDDEKHEDESKH